MCARGGWLQAAWMPWPPIRPPREPRPASRAGVQGTTATAAIHMYSTERNWVGKGGRLLLQKKRGWGRGGGVDPLVTGIIHARRRCRSPLTRRTPPRHGGGALDRRIPSRALSPPRPDGASCPRWAGCRADGATPRWRARVGSCGAALAAAEEKPPRPARARGGRADRGLDRSGGGGGAISAPLGRKLLPIALPR